jgi:hypothetical protein
MKETVTSNNVNLIKTMDEKAKKEFKQVDAQPEEGKRIRNERE